MQQLWTGRSEFFWEGRGFVVAYLFLFAVAMLRGQATYWLARVVTEHATKAGFDVKLVQPLRLHYAKTLDIWSATLQARKDEAIAIQSQEVYDRYMKYLTGCADLFREGYTDVAQFTLTKG